MASKRSRRRRPQASRSMKPTVLIVCQGNKNVTETEYFKQLKRHYRMGSIHIIGESDSSPEKIVSATNWVRQNDKNAPFARVFYVVDVDDSSEAQFNQGFKKARQASTGETACSFVVSNEAFDAWLLAHFEDLRGRAISRRSVLEKLKRLGVLWGTKGKNIDPKFPVAEHEKARKNIEVMEFNQVGKSTASAVPHLLDELFGLLGR
ncbi:RloB domain-containing protein [Corynebacterium sp. 320]|nr:RloB domain-containing protein [Corynebacterium sp. 320]KAB1552832.1 RloB domain-containing protein [Corynebacterium sp. 321]KAB1553950.1 RloB domain-containing protein [Corynebacterium sp. 319]KAB3528205.1 RloB domain-containing protein [Corynebacterium sp. 250]KAB3540307.1 RloB domain-containing protein [Corynebacterium sp. 366]